MSEHNITEDKENDEDNVIKDTDNEKRHLIKNEKHREIVSYIFICIFAMLLALFINTFILSSNRVPSGSMEPTIETHARLFGNRLAYSNSEPQRGG